MENTTETQKKRTHDEFYAVVSALTRFIETADNDIAPAKPAAVKDTNTAKQQSES